MLSCGTANYHVGDSPDHRTLQTCRKHGVPSNHRGQQLHKNHFTTFDYILGMDRSNMQNIKNVTPAGITAHGTPQYCFVHSWVLIARSVALFGDFDTDGACIIEDPYYDGPEAFEVGALINQPTFVLSANVHTQCTSNAFVRAKAFWRTLGRRISFEIHGSLKSASTLVYTLKM